MNSLIKKPTAWIPLALSLVMIVIFLGYFFSAGVPKPETDEGTGAHLFQIWLLLEIILIPLFAIKWLPREPKHAWPILALQLILALLVMAPVFILKL